MFTFRFCFGWHGRLGIDIWLRLCTELHQAKRVRMTSKTATEEVLFSARVRIARKVCGGCGREGRWGQQEKEGAMWTAARSPDKQQSFIRHLEGGEEGGRRRDSFRLLSRDQLARMR